MQPFSIQAAITDGNILTITYWQSIFFNFSLAAGLATVAVNILGLLACIFWSHEKVYYALLTVYIVFEGLLAVMCLVCGIVLLLGVVFSLVACNGVQQLCGPCNWNCSDCVFFNQNDYNTACNEHLTFLKGAAICCFANVLIAIVCTIVGCVGCCAYRRKRKNRDSGTQLQGPV